MLCTGEEGAGVLDGGHLFSPLPLALTELTQDEEHHGEGRAHQRGQHQELEPVYQALKHVSHCLE